MHSFDVKNIHDKIIAERFYHLVNCLLRINFLIIVKLKNVALKTFIKLEKQYKPVMSALQYRNISEYYFELLNKLNVKISTEVIILISVDLILVNASLGLSVTFYL